MHTPLAFFQTRRAEIPSIWTRTFLSIIMEMPSICTLYIFVQRHIFKRAVQKYSPWKAFCFISCGIFLRRKLLSCPSIAIGRRETAGFHVFPKEKRSFRPIFATVGYSAALSHGAFLAKRRRDNLRHFFYASIALSNCYISIKNRIR